MCSPLIRAKILIFMTLIWLSAPAISNASDAAWVIDVSEVASDSLFGMCEDNDVLYFIGISAEQERRLCAVPLDTRELLWTIDLDPGDNFMPVIDEEGNIHITSNINHEAYIITPAGEIIDTIAVTAGEPPYEIEIPGDGTIKWSGTENGYTHLAQAIGKGGMTFKIDTEEFMSFGPFGNVNWQWGSPFYQPQKGFSCVVNNYGMLYTVTSTHGAMVAATSDGVPEWCAPADFCTNPVIGSDGTIYSGKTNNTITRITAEVVVLDPEYLPNSYPGNLNEYTGDADLWDAPNTNPLMIVQDSLLCWGAEGYIEAFVIPSQGYQEDAYWPCFGHDNRRSFTTSAPPVYTVSGLARSMGAPYGGATVELVGTNLTAITDENGAFSFSLPSGTYTFGLSGTSIQDIVTVADAPVSHVVLTDDSEYRSFWTCPLIDDSFRTIYPKYPAVDHQGNTVIALPLIYTYSSNTSPGTVLSVSPDGSQNWRNTFSGQVVRSSPVIDMGNTVYCSQAYYYQGGEYAFIAFDENGSVRWEDWYQTYYTADVGVDSTIYVYKPSIGIVGYDQVGTQIWQSAVDAAGEPVIDSNGTLYVSSGQFLRAFNTDGSQKWSYEAPESLWEATLGNDVIYVSGGTSGTIYEVGSDGTLRRTYQVDGILSCSPAIDCDGTLYIGANDRNFYAFNANGTIKWKTTIPDAVKNTPIIAANGILFTAGDSTLYAFDSDGSIHWKYVLPNETSLNHDYYVDSIYNSYLTLGESGVLYCISYRLKSLYAFQTDSPGLKTTAPWPCYRGNSQRTGRISDDTITPVEISAPREFMPTANYPNPFNPSTTISFYLPERGLTILTVYSAAGQKVATLVDDMLEAGSHNVVFDGSGLASGLYFYRLEAGDVTGTGKMLLVK